MLLGLLEACLEWGSGQGESGARGTGAPRAGNHRVLVSQEHRATSHLWGPWRRESILGALHKIPLN